jgi:hypothetical protein
MFSKILIAIAFVAFAAAPFTANACTLVWNEQFAFRSSEAVVVGTFVPGARRGEGMVRVSRRLKGPKLRFIPIRWDADWVSDGASCDPWQFQPTSPRGRFFLDARSDGTFSVTAQTPMKKAKR